jgi:hypothetical protein
MILDQVQAAEQIVTDAVGRMNAVSQQLQAQAAASMTAMKAPAGAVTSQNYDLHSGAGRALAEVLGQLKADLTQTRMVLLTGSQDALSVAQRVETGSGSIASQM